MIRGGAVVLPSRDVGRSVRFYVETLGMKLVAEREDGTATIDAGEGFLIELTPGDVPKGPAPTVLLRPKVPLDEVIAIFENRGVVFTREGGVARFTDPDGHPLALAEVP